MKEKNKREYEYNIKLIKEYMNKYGYDNEQFAKVCRITESELEKILSNNIHVPLICLLRISGVIRVPYEALFIINN